MRWKRRLSIYASKVSTVYLPVVFMKGREKKRKEKKTRTVYCISTVAAFGKHIYDAAATASTRITMFLCKQVAASSKWGSALRKTYGRNRGRERERERRERLVLSESCGGVWYWLHVPCLQR